MKKSLVVEIIAMILVFLFLYTGISKLIDYPIFKEQIALSPILAPFSMWLAVLLPAIEIIVSVLLFIPLTRLKGLRASLVLMLLFTGYIIYIMNFNEHLPCTCGGVLQALTWGQHLVLNITLLLLSILAIMLKKQTIKMDSK